MGLTQAQEEPEDLIAEPWTQSDSRLANHYIQKTVVDRMNLNHHFESGVRCCPPAETGHTPDHGAILFH